MQITEVPYVGEGGSEVQLVSTTKAGKKYTAENNDYFRHIEAFNIVYLLRMLRCFNWYEYTVSISQNESNDFFWH